LLNDRSNYRSPVIASPDGNASVGARAVFSVPERWGLLILFALIVIFRLPNAWVHGRFQDEEATVFLAYAWHHPWFEALFRPFAGYWNLGANSTTVLVAQLVKSGMLPLERAPYLTMGMALAFQLMPAVLILTGSAEWLANRLAVIASLLVIAIAPATEEVFFNVLHIQFHLALCVALILALDVPRRRAERVGYGALLFLAPLCGPGAIIILPLFALRALIDRDLTRLSQLGPLVAGATLQLLLFYGSSPLRGHVVDPVTVAAAMFVRLIALPLTGIGFANRAGQIAFASQSAGGSLYTVFAAVTAVLFAVLIASAARRRDGAVWLALSALVIAVVSLSVGIVLVDRSDLFKVLRGERYNFLPLVLLGLSVVALAMRSPGWGRLIYGLLLSLMLVSGTIWYFRPSPEYSDGPFWRAQVQAWRADHDHPLAVWPRPWAADLSDRARACSPPTGDLARSTDPRYCESGWIAGFYR
jgi:hypothetical protein